MMRCEVRGVMLGVDVDGQRDAMIMVMEAMTEADEVDVELPPCK